MQKTYFLTGKFKNSNKNRLNFYYLFVLFIMAFAAWLFWHGINGEFLFDDWQVLLQSDFVRNPSAWFTGYRPLRNLSYVIDLQFGALTPFTFHFSNLVYHLINIILVSIALNLIFRPILIFEKMWVAGIIIVFAIHPVQVESVVYISGRRDLLFTMFYLFGIIIFLKMIDNYDVPLDTENNNCECKKDMKWIWAWGWVLIITVFSTLSKESGITLPVFCFMLQQYFYGQWGGKWGKASLKYLIVCFLILAALLFYSISMAMPSLSAGYMGGSFLTHIENCSWFLFKYIGMAFYPVHYAADYSDFSLKFIENPLSLKGVVSIFSACLITIFALADLFLKSNGSFAYKGRSAYNGRFTGNGNFKINGSFAGNRNLKGRNQKDISATYIFSLGWLWFVITIFPMINLVPHIERFALHYLYLPLTGIFIAVWGIWSFILNFPEGKCSITQGWCRSKIPMYLLCMFTGVVFCLFVVSLTIKTENEINWWQNAVVFWEHNVKINPQCARANANLGTALIRAGHLRQAEKALKRAVAIKNLPQAFIGMASIAIDEKDYNKAVKLLDHVPENRIRIEKYRLFLLGLVAVEQGNIADARAHAESLCRNWPGFDGGYYLKGKIKMKLSDYKMAVLFFKQAVDICPFVQRDYVELIRALVINHQLNSAMMYIERGFKKKLWEKDNPFRLNDLGYISELMGSEQKAIQSYQSALNADKGCIIAALNLSRILYQKKQFKQIISLAQNVVISDFKNVDKQNCMEASKFMNNVGLANIMLGKNDEGRKFFKRSVKLWPENKIALKNLSLLK